MVRLIQEILDRVGIHCSTVRLPNSDEVASAMRTVLGQRCPLCGGSLPGHRYGTFASFLIDGVAIRDRHSVEKIFMERVECLPAEGANDPTRDVVWYALLECPISQDDIVVEHFSGADVISEESATPIHGIDRGRRDSFRDRCYDWSLL